MTKLSNIFRFFIFTAFVNPSYGAYEVSYFPSTSRGLETTYFTDGASGTEECVIPKVLLGVTPTTEDLKISRDLCKLDFARDPICPKLTSTNPGVEVYQAPTGVTKEAFEASECHKARHRAGDRIAKFKQSLTCSYAPSIVAYAQISRILGYVTRTPPSVIRTYSKNSHQQLVRAGGAYATKLYSPAMMIRQAWVQMWPDAYLAPAKNPALFTQDLNFIYGALSQDTHDDFYYSEVNGDVVGKYSVRYEIFSQTAAFQRVKDARPIATSLARDLSAAAQTIVQMKDITDMLVMDYLLNQQDRIGNILYQAVWYWQENGELKRQLANMKGNAVEPNESLEMKSRHAVFVKEMLLRDNDCGVAKTNMVRIKKLVEPIGHISPETYYRLLYFQRELAKESVQNEIKLEWLFTPRDLTGLIANANALAGILKTKCQAGGLKLDLNLNDHLSGKAAAQSCDLPSGFAL